MELFEEVAAETAARAARDGVREDEAVEAVGVLGLALQSLEDLLGDRVALRVAVRPVVARTAALFAHEHVLGVVEVRLVALANALDGLVLEVEQNGARHKARIIRLVEEN